MEDKKVDMERKEFTLNLEEARRLYNKDINFHAVFREILESKFPELKPERGLTWGDVDSIEGCHITGNTFVNEDTSNSHTKGLFKTKKEAQSAKAYAQITQIIARDCYNGEPMEDWCDWDNGSSGRYVIRIRGCEPHLFFVNIGRQHIAFKTKELAEKFLSFPENVELVKQFYMV